MRTLLLAALLALPALAYGQQVPHPPCAPIGIVQNVLGAKFGEQLSGLGAVGKAEVAFFLNPKTRTFTIVVVRKDGLACATGIAGEHWRGMAVKAPGEGA